MQFLFAYFSLQVEIKPHDGVAKCVFILELGVVTNTIGHGPTLQK
jgi:hypothetical protein